MPTPRKPMGIFSVAFIESPESANLRSLLSKAIRKILLNFESKKASHKVFYALRVLKAFQMSTPDGLTFNLDVEAIKGEADSGVLSDDLTDLLLAVGEAARDRDAGVLIAIDEVQYLSSEELAALITAVHRTTQKNLPVVLVGTGLPQIPGLAGDAKSYAERLFEFPEIGSLSGPDATAALVVPAREEGVEYAPAAIDAILEATHGYPFFLQEWGYRIWNEAETSPIGVDVVESAHPKVIQHLDDNFFLVRFDRLTPKAKQYLRAMAELGPGPHRSGDIAAVLKVKFESIAPRRSGLIAKGMIYSPAHGDTAFTVPLFDEFLKRVIPNREAAEYSGRSKG